MLQGINRIGKSWVGRVIVTIMFGFLIVSFAIWGIGDIFRGGIRTQVARVGGADIAADSYRAAYQNEYQALIRRTRQSITPDMARALGLEQRVLARLVSEAAFDQETRRLGLAVSDASVVRAIQADPSFQGPSGSFERTRFNELLREAGLFEGQYVADQRSVVARQQLAEAIAGGVNAPLALREAVHRYQTERRDADYVTIGAAALGEIAASTDAQLQGFFDERKATYRVPELRSANILVLTPETIMKPGEVSDEDARAFYEREKNTRFGRPERRSVEQIVFPSREEADAASEKIKAGTPFETVAAERGISGPALSLGTFTQGEMLDPAAATAVFALAEGAVGGPVEGRFGPILVRAAKVEPAATKPFEEVAGDVRRDLALDRARNAVGPIHDAIEDQRAGAKPLAEIAKEQGRDLRAITGFDRAGTDAAGKGIGPLPVKDALLTAVFRSEIGSDNEALRTPDGGYVWFEVTKVDPTRDQALAEVREKVAADWRKAEVARLLADKARDLAARLDKGEPIAALAAEAGAAVETATELRRGQGTPSLAPAIVARIFATPVGKAGAASATDENRVLFKVSAARMPPFVTTTQEAGAADAQLRNLVADDLLAEYMSDLEARVGVQYYPENIRRAIGGSDG